MLTSVWRILVSTAAHVEIPSAHSCATVNRAGPDQHVMSVGLQLIWSTKILYVLNRNQKFKTALSIYQELYMKLTFITKSLLWQLLTCGARGSGIPIQFPLLLLQFQRLVISYFQVTLWLKYRWSDVILKQPTIQPLLLHILLVLQIFIITVHRCWWVSELHDMSQRSNVYQQPGVVSMSVPQWVDG